MHTHTPSIASLSFALSRAKNSYRAGWAGQKGQSLGLGRALGQLGDFGPVMGLG